MDKGISEILVKSQKKNSNGIFLLCFYTDLEKNNGSEQWSIVCDSFVLIP